MDFFGIICPLLDFLFMFDFRFLSVVLLSVRVLFFCLFFYINLYTHTFFLFAQWAIVTTSINLLPILMMGLRNTVHRVCFEMTRVESSDQM